MAQFDLASYVFTTGETSRDADINKLLEELKAASAKARYFVCILNSRR